MLTKTKPRAKSEETLPVGSVSSDFGRKGVSSCFGRNGKILRRDFLRKTHLNIFLVGLFLASIPLVSHAALVECGNGKEPCHFADFLKLAQNIINFLMQMAIIFGGLSIAFAGLKYMLAQGNEAEIKKVHDIMYWAIGGILLTLGAWLIIYTIVSTLGVKTDLQSPF